MFHRHEPREQSVDWPTAEGTIVAVGAVASADGPEAPTSYEVDLRPEVGAPFRADVRLPQGARLHVGFYSRGRAHGPLRARVREPKVGETAWFVIDPKSQTVQFDLFDRRNMDMPGHEKEWANKVVAHSGDAPARSDAVPGSPRWVLPAECPNCGAKIAQAAATFELEPRCEFCHAPLPVQPFAGARLTAADIVARGTACRAEVVKFAQADAAEGQPAEAAPWAFMVNLAPDGAPPYQVEAAMAVPANAVPLLHRGWRPPVVFLPSVDPRLLAIDWDKALATGAMSTTDSEFAPIVVSGDRRYWAYYDNPDDGYDHLHTEPPYFGRPLGSRADWPCHHGPVDPSGTPMSQP